MLALALTTALSSAPAMPVASYHAVPRIADDSADNRMANTQSQDNSDPMMPRTRH
jgi:hypothetical protein